MRASIDLNSDLGEYDDFATAPDADVLRCVSSVSLSCGVHAGTPQSIEQTVAAAVAQGVAIGAHPSYPDREGFGRRSLTLPLHELAAEIRKQILWLKALVERHGTRLVHVKPHGALYFDLAQDDIRVAMLCDVVKDIDPTLALMGLAQTPAEAIVRMHGVRWIAEGFADRRYDAPGVLRPRVQSDALITVEAELLAQVEQLLAQPIDSICLHGDTPGARQLACAIRSHIESMGITIKPA